MVYVEVLAQSMLKAYMTDGKSVQSAQNRIELHEATKYKTNLECRARSIQAEERLHGGEWGV